MQVSVRTFLFYKTRDLGKIYKLVYQYFGQ